MADDEWSEVYVGDLQQTARDQVLYLLRDQPLRFDAEREVVRFPHGLRSVVMGAVDEAAEVDLVARGIHEHHEARHDPAGGPEIAGRTRRVAAGAVDYVLIGLATFVLVRLLDGIGSRVTTGWLSFLIAEWSVVVIPMAVTGRPIGARVAGTTVVRDLDHSIPSWIACGLRWVVAHLPVIVVGAAIDIRGSSDIDQFLWIVQIVGLAAVYAGVFIHRSGQGLHDLAAGTIVVTNWSRAGARTAGS